MIRFFLIAVTLFNIYIEASGILQQNLTLREYWGINREQTYISGGIPLPKGLINDVAQISLNSPSGAAVPFQSRPLLRWQDGSLRWLLMTFPADVNANSTANYKLTMQRDGRFPAVSYASGKITINENSTHVIVSTGKMILQIKKQGGFNLFDRVIIDADNDGSVDDEIVSPDISNGAFIRDMYDTLYTGNNSPAHEVKVEESDPLRAIIRITGNHSDGIFDHRFYGYLVRIYVNAGQSEVRVQYTIKNSYFKPRGVLAFKSMLLRIKPNLSGTKNITYYDDSLRSSVLNDSAYVYQPWPFGFETKVNGATLHSIDTTDKNARTLGWMDISDSKQGVAVGIYNFASQTPKELFASNDGSLEARLWPARYPQGKDSANYSRGGYEVDRFYIGMAEHKTHEVLFHFHGSSAISAGTPSKMAAFNHRILPTMDSKWVSLSRAVIGEMSPDSLPSPDPSILSNRMPLINKVLGDPSYVKGTGISKYYYDTWINYGESYARNDRNSTEYYENQGIRYLRCPSPQAFRLLEGTAWVAADMRQCHLDSMVGVDNRMSLHFWLGDSSKVIDSKHHVYPAISTTNLGRYRLWIAPTPGAQTEHYTSFDLFNYYLLTGDLKIRDAIYEWGESNADYKSFINTNNGMSGMGRGSNSAWCTMMFAALIENSDTVKGGRTYKKYFEDQLHTWTQGLPGKKGILASLGPSGAWGTFVHNNYEGPHNYFEALVDFGFSWYAENYWNDSLKTYFDRRIKCMRDSVFTKTGNIMYHGWGYYDSTTPPSQTAPSNYRIPGSLARLFYFSGDTTFERKMNLFCMDGKNPVFAQQDLQFMGKYDMTVYQAYLFYLNNKANYRKNPIIDWEYPDEVEQGDYKNVGSKLSLLASPNPFNPAITIKLSEIGHGLPLQSTVLLKIVTPDGRTMLEKQFTVGALMKGFIWNGHNVNNKSIATGIYFVKIAVLGKSAVKRVMLIK